MNHLQPIYIVTGLPRSGTSLGMQLLAAGGIQPFTDFQRVADTNNPRGYFESEKVLGLPRDSSWLGEARGHALKVVVPLLQYLPDEYSYKVVFMDRPLWEVVHSQEQMLKALNKKGAGIPSEKMMEVFQKEIDRVKLLLSKKPMTSFCHISYPALFGPSSTALGDLAEFIGCVHHLESMRKVIDPDLYRSKL